MKLSLILSDSYFANIEYKIINEKEFKSLMLVASQYKEPACVFIESSKYFESLPENVSMVICNQTVSIPENKIYGYCLVDNPRELFFRIHNYLSIKDEYGRPKKPTQIGIGCEISKLSYIDSSNVVIGNNVIIEEFVSIKNNVIVGNNCVIRAGTVIGGEGFEVKRSGEETFSVKHCGGVIIGHDTEIFYNSTIDKAVYPWDNTVIGDYSRIEDLVSIAHGVKIGNRVFINGGSMIAGRSIIGNDCWISGKILNGLTIGNHSHINWGSVVYKNIPNNCKTLGNPAKVMGYICNCGNDLDEKLHCPKCGKIFIKDETGNIAER